MSKIKSREDILKIARNMLENLSKRSAAIGIEVKFDESVAERVAEVGFDAVYGARPLRRAIQSKIEDMLSEEIIDGNVKKGDKITIDANENSFYIE